MYCEYFWEYSILVQLMTAASSCLNHLCKLEHNRNSLLLNVVNTRQSLIKIKYPHVRNTYDIYHLGNKHLIESYSTLSCIICLHRVTYLNLTILYTYLQQLIFTCIFKLYTSHIHHDDQLIHIVFCNIYDTNVSKST